MRPNVTILNCEQRSETWFAARCGRLTASDAGKMLARIKSGEAADRRDLRTKLVVERLTGQPAENGYVSADMQRGIDLEAEARRAYEARTGELVTEVGFLAHTELLVGCSPDGLVGDMGGVEIKVPKSATHLRYLQQAILPTEYVAQVTHTLWVTGASFWDFVSYDPRFPDPLKLFIVRVVPEKLDLIGYEDKALSFLAEVDDEYRAVQALVERQRAVQLEAEVIF